MYCLISRNMNLVWQNNGDKVYKIVNELFAIYTIWNQLTNIVNTTVFTNFNILQKLINFAFIQFFAKVGQNLNDKIFSLNLPNRNIKQLTITQFTSRNVTITFLIKDLEALNEFLRGTSRLETIRSREDRQKCTEINIKFYVFCLALKCSVICCTINKPWVSGTFLDLAVSLTSSATSAWVGFWPRPLKRSPRLTEETVLLPFLSYKEKASFHSFFVYILLEQKKSPRKRNIIILYHRVVLE